jgi:hypothetical protein
LSTTPPCRLPLPFHRHVATIGARSRLPSLSTASPARPPRRQQAVYRPPSPRPSCVSLLWPPQKSGWLDRAQWCWWKWCLPLMMMREWPLLVTRVRMPRCLDGGRKAAERLRLRIRNLPASVHSRQPALRVSTTVQLYPGSLRPLCRPSKRTAAERTHSNKLPSDQKPRQLPVRPPLPPPDPLSILVERHVELDERDRERGERSDQVLLFRPLLCGQGEGRRLGLREMESASGETGAEREGRNPYIEDHERWRHKLEGVDGMDVWNRQRK